MALTADKLINDERFSGDLLYFLWYLPLGIILTLLRLCLVLILWIASIILPIVLPNKSIVRQLLSTLACWTFGVYVKQKGTKGTRCSVLVANYVSCLDSLAAAHVLGTISLRKWKVPPFFASTLGIKNSAQFIRKQHFTEAGSRPVLLQPEGGPSNGRGLLRFCDWPFPAGNRVQPVVITVERPFTAVTVHRPWDSCERCPWSDLVWFLWSPWTVFTLTLLPPVEKHDDDQQEFVRKIQSAIADQAQLEITEFSWDDIVRGRSAAGAAGAGGRASPAGELARLAARVKEVLPRVPMRDIMRDLATTRSVDVTITNFLEGVVPYTPELQPGPEPTPSTSQAAPKYITPVPTGTFPKTAKERQVSFQERKAQMIAEARKRYIEKNGLNLALNNC